MGNSRKIDSNFSTLLRQADYRATPGRVTLLKILWYADKPLSVTKIEEKISGALNRVTIYRALEALVSTGIVRRIDLRHDHAHYELADRKKHHHHLICQRCGLVEDFTNCSVARNIERVLQKSDRFSIVREHSLELFGLCHNCV